MTQKRVTTLEAADQLRVPASAIRKWKHRGDVTPIGLLPGRGKPVPVYDLSDLEPLAKRYREWHLDHSDRRGA